MSKVHRFKPRARLLLLLGDQLIRNESVALLELVKNGYDAGATVVQIEMFGVKDESDGYITVTDDGHGMDEKTITNIWLEPGTDYQVHQLANIEGAKSGSSRVVSTRNGRRIIRKPLGEKGIGRFAAHKLGDYMEIVSKKEGSAEVSLTFDWAELENHEYLHQIRLDVQTARRSKLFRGDRTGTQIKVSKLRHIWTKAEIRDLYRSTVAMCSPFKKPDSFRIEFTSDDAEDLKNLPNHEEMLEQALYSFDCTVRGDEIVRFRYTFQPFEQMTRVNPREILYPFPKATSSSTQIRNGVTPVRDPAFEKSRWLVRTIEDEFSGDKILEKVSLEDVGIGDVRFHGYIFDREPKTLALATIEPKALKEYIATNGGVRVYRDGVRVYDYGEPGNDWLDLQARRVARPGVKLDANLLVAAVELDRSSSKSLIEKTNREGFVEDEAFDTLVEVILQCLQHVENYRFEDKERIRLNYGVSNRKDRVPLTDRLIEARELIEQKISDPADKRALATALTRVEDDYEFISKTLLTSAGAGMQLGLAVHEIEKIVDELTAFVARDAVPSRVRELVRRLSQLVERYSTVLRRGDKHEEDLKSVIKDATFFTEYRFELHGVELVPEYEKFKGNTKLTCIANLVTTGILNLMDNSIYWLDYAKVEAKRILVDLREAEGGGISVVVADNGRGFNLSPELMIRPFISKRPKGSGLGLYLLDEIMTIHGGILSFPDASEMKLPPDFSHGAVTVLTFNRGDRIK